MAGVAPLTSTWIAAVHASAMDFTPLGTAVVIDDRRVLTSAHVVMFSGKVRPQVWVAFPMSEDPSAPGDARYRSGSPRTRWRILPWWSWRIRSRPGWRRRRCGARNLPMW